MLALQIDNSQLEDLRLEDVIPIKIWSMDQSFPCRRRD
jgi:hypothetical protein